MSGSLRDSVAEAVLKIICGKDSGLVFNEIYEEVKRVLGSDPGKSLVREVLAEHVRRGLVRREPSHERARMVFKPGEC